MDEERKEKLSSRYGYEVVVLVFVLVVERPENGMKWGRPWSEEEVIG